MEASSVFIKTEIEDAEYERSYNYSSNDTLVNNEEDYTVTVNPEAVLDIKYERGIYVYHVLKMICCKV